MENPAQYEVPGQYEYEEGVIKSLPWYPRESLDRVKVFDYKDGDIVIASYPKSGNTWTSEITTLLASQGDTTSNMMQEVLMKRVKYMEMQMSPQAPPFIDILEKTPPPRIMKTHLPAHFFRKGLDSSKGKFTVVMRNFKDTLVSYYHYYLAMRTFGPFPGTWNDFFELFKAKRLLHGDILQYNLSWWKERHRENVLILKYEDMKKDPVGEVSRCAAFYGHSVKEDVLQSIVKATSFEVMKDNPLSNMSTVPVYDYSKGPFMRKGVVGDWKNYFTQEQSDYVDKYYSDKAAEEGLHFES